jgi:hypothetical protein
VYKSYEEWLKQVPASITQDPLWSFETYRKALFLSDHVFDPSMLDRRLKLADEIISGLVTTAKQQYKR